MSSLIGQAWVRVCNKTERWWDESVPDAIKTSIKTLILAFALIHVSILMIFYFYWFIAWIAE